ncbi:polysaccharide biosynthesis tyrosine autokinase [Edaphobacter sp. HDX4]|uniref:GumC family protein n=1 Tax=Edaphobacter sp. HDX4 TaxID=2794064 RepID=UPI002FE54B22
MKPVYESEGRLQIDPPGAEVFSLDASGVGLIDSEYIATEAQKLQTDDMALQTIQKLHLESNPEILSNATKNGEGNASDGSPERETAAIRNFKSKISIRRDPSSRLVGVTFAAHDPRLSADVVNTLMGLLVEQNLQARRQAIEESSASLSGHLDDIRAKMQASARALSEYGTKTRIADVDPNSNTYAEKMGDLNKQLAQASSDRIQFESFLARTNAPDALPQVRSNLVIQALTQKLAESEAQLAQSRVIYGPNHAEVRKLENQVAELQNQIKSQTAVIVSELRTNYRAARTREFLLSGAVDSATQDLAVLSQYNVLKRQAQADRDLYDNLYAKVKEAGIAAASKSSNIHIVSRARILDRPTRPRRTLNILGGIFLGLIGGVALAFIKDRLQDRIHTAEEVRDWTGLPAVTVVPIIQRKQNETSGGSTNRSQLKLECERDSGHIGPDCFFLKRPDSPESEAVNTLRTMLFVSRPERAPKVTLVTSPLPGEGKTTLCNNLAVALAKHGRTCLVDADLKMPMVGRSFNLTRETGLEHYLQGTATLEQVMSPMDEIANLTIIPATLPTEHSNYLLTGDPIKALMNRLRESFDFVLIDTPPILLYADGLAVSTLVDGVILVGRAGQTPRGAITRSMDLLGMVKSAPILSIVLNGVDEHHRYGAYSY